MVGKILENVINEMAPHLNREQMEHLSNVLFVNFHGKDSGSVHRVNGNWS